MINKKLKVIIVDDHPIFRDGFRVFLEQLAIIDEVECAENGFVFLEKMHNNHFDIAFLDISMPLKNGFDAAKEAMNLDPNLKIIAISSHDNIEYVDRMLACGAMAYILKDADKIEIEESISKVMMGSYFFSSKVLVNMSQRVHVKNTSDNFNDNSVQITEREKEVLILLCKGLNRKEISDKLFISERTVDKHRENLLSKTRTDNIVRLVIYAIRNKLVKIDELPL